MKRVLFAVLFTLATAQANAQTSAVSGLLSQYRSEGAGAPNAKAGETMWTRKVARDGEERSCSTCHTADLTKGGKHATTGKAIEPMAPSANAQRLTDPEKIEKWFTRNCRWTYGRVCSPQEKADFLAYIQAQ